MPRKVRDHRLDTRSARDRLPRRAEPYWRILGGGVHLGYFKGARVGKWVVRSRTPGSAKTYRKARLGEADDAHDANGTTIFSFSQAQQAALAWAQAHGDGQWSGAYTVSNAVDDYLAAFSGKSLHKTKGRIERVIRPQLGQIRLSKLTTQRVTEWHQGRGKEVKSRSNLAPAEGVRRARSTANRDLTILKAALNHAFHRGMVANDLAWRRVKPFPNVEGVRTRCLTLAECQRLIAACAVPFRPMIEAALLTGARYGDLARAKTADFDAQSRTLLLRQTKGGGSRLVFLNDEGARFFKTLVAGKDNSDPLLPRPDGKHWTDSQQVRFMQLASESAKLDPPATYHDLRRTYGAWLALNGVPMAVIAEALGHRDERLTRRHYAHLAPSYVAETVRNALNPLGIAPTPLSAAV